MSKTLLIAFGAAWLAAVPPSAHAYGGWHQNSGSAPWDPNPDYWAAQAYYQPPYPGYPVIVPRYAVPRYVPYWVGPRVVYPYGGYYGAPYPSPYYGRPYYRRYWRHGCGNGAAGAIAGAGIGAIIGREIDRAGNTYYRYRRSDGTTGLVLGATLGALLGLEIGRSC